jgi:hypothetical protein
VLMASKPSKKQKRVAAMEDVAAAVDLDFERLTFKREELTSGKIAAWIAQDFHRQPRHGLSEEVLSIFRSLEGEAAGWNPPRMTMQALLRSGTAIRVSLNTMCTADCLKIDKPSRKGNPGAVVACSVCFRSYHVKCMESEGVVASGLKKANIIRMVFVCGTCGGTAGSNRAPIDENIARRNDAAEAEPVANAALVRPDKRRRIRKRK